MYYKVIKRNDVYGRLMVNTVICMAIFVDIPNCYELLNGNSVIIIVPQHIFTRILVILLSVPRVKHACRRVGLDFRKRK